MWTLLLASAQAATWTYRAPVPTSAPSDGRPLSACIVLGLDLGLDEVVSTVGNTTLTCTTEEVEERRISRLCFVVQPEDWPTAWPTVSCAGPKTTLELQLVPAYDSADDPLDGLSIYGGVDELVAFFEVDPSWPAQRTEGRRGTICQVHEGRLMVTQDRPSRRRDACTLRRRDGSTFEVPITFTRSPP